MGSSFSPAVLDEESGDQMLDCITLKKITLLLLVLTQISLFSATAHAQPPDNTIKVTIIPHRSNLGNEQAYSTLFGALEKETGLTFEWIGSKTYDDVIKKITKGTADIGYVGPFAYVDAQDGFGVQLICRTLSRNKVEFYHSMIVTRKDSSINSLQDLKGKRFSFTDPKSTSGYLFPMAQLIKSGLTLDDFSETRFLKRHANSLLAVYKGHVDAGATSYTAVDKIDINMDAIQIIWKSDPIYRGPWIARKDLPAEQVKLIRQAMLKLGAPGENQELFNNLTTKGFVEAKDSDYDNVRDVLRWLQDK